MNPTFVSDKRDRQQNNHHNEDDALFVFGKFENAEKPLHFFA
jgi:hypothetical protein